MQQICKSYFNGPREICDFRNNGPKINALAMAKILSFFTIILPVALGLVLGVSLGIDYLRGRCCPIKQEEAIPEPISTETTQNIKRAKNLSLLLTSCFREMNREDITPELSKTAASLVSYSLQNNMTKIKEIKFDELIASLEDKPKTTNVINTLKSIKEWVAQLN